MFCFAGHRRHEKSQSNWLVLWPCRFEAVIACYLDAAGPSNAMSSLGCLSCIIYQFRGVAVVATCSICRLLAVGHASASPSLGGILLPGHACLQGTATETGALPGCFVAGVLARWYQFARQEGTPIAEQGSHRILHLFLGLWTEGWSRKSGYVRSGTGQPCPKPKNVQYSPR